jgi:uncharacterized protein YjbI with pentapeptide repeats
LSSARLTGQNLTFAKFGSATLRQADFGQANLANALFNRADLSEASFHESSLIDASFSLATLVDAELGQADLTRANLQHATLSGASFHGAIVRMARFDYSGITSAQLYSTASYATRDLAGIGLAGIELPSADFSGQNLTSASFSSTTLTDADFRQANLSNVDFTDATLAGADFAAAEVQGANFGGTTYDGFTAAQLYATNSYQAGDLTGILLERNDLSGWYFTGQNLRNASFHSAHLVGADFRQANLANAFIGGANLTSASFHEANLADTEFLHLRCFFERPCFRLKATFANADLTAADARGAKNFDLPASAITTNLIRPDGHVSGLELDTNVRLVVRDYDGDLTYGLGSISVTIDEHLTMGPGGTLRMVFEADAWDSTISFAAGIPVALGGTLELTFADNMNLASQVGRTFDLFDWTGVTPTGAFAVSSPYTWELSNLYTTGEITLTAVPEPGSFVLAAVGAFSLTLYRRRKIS